MVRNRNNLQQLVCFTAILQAVHTSTELRTFFSVHTSYFPLSLNNIHTVTILMAIFQANLGSLVALSTLITNLNIFGQTK